MFPYTQLFVNGPAQTFAIGNNSPMDIGRALGQICRERNIRAADLARGVGVSPGTISKYMSGKLLPGLDVLEGLAAVIGCHAYEIVARAEGVTVVPTHHSPDDAKWLELRHAMEPEARYHVEAIATTLANRK